MANAAAKNAATTQPMQHVYNWGPGIAILFAIGSFLYTFYQFGTMAGGSDHWVNIQSQVQSVLVWVIIATALFMIGSLGYFLQDPVRAVYFSIVVSCIALGVAYGALSVAVISR